MTRSLRLPFFTGRCCMVLQLIFFGLCVHFSRRALMEDYSVTREENKSCVFCCQSRTVIPGVEAKTSMMLHTHVVLFTAVVNYLRPPTQAVSPHAHLPCCFCTSTWWRWETVEGKRHMFQILCSVENIQTWKLMNNSARLTVRFTRGAQASLREPNSIFVNYVIYLDLNVCICLHELINM